MTNKREARQDTDSGRIILGETSFLPLYRRVNQAMAVRLARSGLPVTSAATLLHLHTTPDDSEPSRLADEFHAPRQTMTFILDALERMELARRTPHPVDRRKKVIELTSKGRRLAQSILDDLLLFEAKAAAATFSPSELETFRAFVVKFAKALEQQNNATASI